MHLLLVHAARILQQAHPDVMLVHDLLEGAMLADALSCYAFLPLHSAALVPKLCCPPAFVIPRLFKSRQLSPSFCCAPSAVVVLVQGLLKRKAYSITCKQFQPGGTPVPLLLQYLC